MDMQCMACGHMDSGQKVVMNQKKGTYGQRKCTRCKTGDMVPIIQTPNIELDQEFYGFETDPYLNTENDWGEL